MSVELIARIGQELRAGKGAVLATIVKRIGSAPRSSGSRMLVFEDKSIFGTIGGGSLEAQVRETAAEVMVSKNTQVQEYNFSGNEAASMEMICGGTVKILIEWLDPANQELLETIEKLDSLLSSFSDSWWIQAVSPSLRVEHGCFMKEWDQVWGVQIDPQSVREVKLISWLETPQISYFIERLNLRGTVLIFGAGHVAQSVAHLCHLVDFATIIFDDRLEYANQVRFPEADEILVSGAIEKGFEDRVIDENCYIVIVTRGHLHDQEVLEQTMATRAGYIGMIGSKRKWNLIREALVVKGFTDAQIGRVYTPIGLDIGAETPAEIAISIVAELVKARAGRYQL